MLSVKTCAARRCWCRARFLDIAPGDGVEILARRIDPLIEPDVPALHVFRHERFAPPGRPAGSPGIILHPYGNGQVAYARGAALQPLLG